MSELKTLTNENKRIELCLTLYGRPYTKKNSQRIAKNRKTGAHFVKPSANYEE